MRDGERGLPSRGPKGQEARKSRASPGAPYLRSKCTGWTPTSQTRPGGRPGDACAADSGRRRVSGRPGRSAVSCGVLWTVGSETTPGARERARELGVRNVPPSRSGWPGWVLEPRAAPQLPRGEGRSGLAREGRGGPSTKQPRVKDFVDPWGDSQRPRLPCPPLARQGPDGFIKASCPGRALAYDCGARLQPVVALPALCQRFARGARTSPLPGLGEEGVQRGQRGSSHREPARVGREGGRNSERSGDLVQKPPRRTAGPRPVFRLKIPCVTQIAPVSGARLSPAFIG